jgi:hypothetical protein
MSFLGLNRLSRLILQPSQWNMRIPSYLNISSNRNDSNSFFVKHENQHESSKSSQPIRKVILVWNFMCFIITNLKYFQNSSESFVSSFKNLSRRVKFYDRSEPSENDESKEKEKSSTSLELMKEDEINRWDIN